MTSVESSTPRAGGPRRFFTETKLGTKTSEFYVMIVAVVGIIIVTFWDNDERLSYDDGFRYATFVVVAYILSRGLAKLGRREPYIDERD